MYKYNSKDVLKIFRGGSTIYDVCNEVVPKLFNNNEIGYWYDPDDLDSTKLKWRRNLFTETEFRNGITDLPIKGGSFSFVPFAGLTQGTGVQIDMNAGGTYVYKTYAHKAGVIYNFSAYIRMQDGSAPVLGQSGSGAGADVDVCVVIKGNTAAPSITTLTDLGGGLYRVSVLINNSVTATYFGFVKYATNSTKPVIVSGYQLEEGSEVSTYQPITNFYSEFLNAFPKHTLFQDSSGTIPVTNGSQPVGLILDKSKLLTIGSELFINVIDFTNWSRNAAVTSYTDKTFTTNGLGGVIKNPIIPGGFSVNKTYMVRLIGTTTASLFVRSSSSTVGQVSLPIGNFDITIRSNSTFRDGTIYFQLQAAGVVSITSISVKEIAGNHAFQDNSSSRPILQQTPTLGSEYVVNGTFQTNVSGWGVYLCTAVKKDNGVLITTTSAGSPQLSQIRSDIMGKTVYVSAKFKNKLGYSINTKLVLYNSSVGDIRGVQSTGTSGELSFIATVPPGVIPTLICMMSTADVGSSVEFSDISIKEVTGYSSTQNYLAFDGIDDFLITTAINLSTVDKLSLFTGIRKLSDAATGTVLEFSTNKNTNNGVFSLFAPLNVGVSHVVYTSKGTVERAAANNNIVAPSSSVILIQSSISDDISSLKINGSTVSNIGDQGTGNYGNFPLYIGRRSGSALPFNGRIYSLIGVSRLTTASENSVIEKAIALKLGITL